MNQASIFIGGRQSINPEEVISLRADVNYTKVFLADGKKIIVATTLKEIESRFRNCPKFFRISKSQIINIDCINNIQNEKILLKNGEIIVASRRRKKAFFETINHL